MTAHTATFAGTLIALTTLGCGASSQKPDDPNAASVIGAAMTGFSQGLSQSRKNRRNDPKFVCKPSYLNAGEYECEPRK